MLVWICLALIVVPLLIERAMARHWRRQIGRCIHVHGSRGKSSVVRESARLLRAEGVKVLAKTTGDQPEYLLPDGQVMPIRRLGSARIQEHVAALHKAARLKVDTLIVEGMALAPETVWQSQEILDADQAVITNTRPDHAETMQGGREGVIRTLSLMIPTAGTLVCADETGAAQLAEIAESRNTLLNCVACATRQDQAPALARALTGSPSEPGSIQDVPDVVATAGPRWLDLPGGDLPVRLLDLLSANDVESSALLWADNRANAHWLKIAVLATRADRPLRSRDFWTWLTSSGQFDLLVPQGAHAGYCWRRGLRDVRLVLAYPWSDPGDLVQKLTRRAVADGKCGVAIVGLGNVHGIGERWRRFGETVHAHAG